MTLEKILMKPKKQGKNDLSLEEHQTVIKSCFPLLNPTDILLPLPEKVVSENNNVYTGKVKPNSKSYIDITMRWLETIPFYRFDSQHIQKAKQFIVKSLQKTLQDFFCHVPFFRTTISFIC